MRVRSHDSARRGLSLGKGQRQAMGYIQMDGERESLGVTTLEKPRRYRDITAQFGCA
ncbi:hypothetical protein MFM001_14970 [Mycobacterium sp. MFM001]|nr:hypothetical protein MFM001_14970 [Mycobacterium sp. MFM001]